MWEEKQYEFRFISLFLKGNYAKIKRCMRNYIYFLEFEYPAIFPIVNWKKNLLDSFRKSDGLLGTNGLRTCKRNCYVSIQHFEIEKKNQKVTKKNKWGKRKRWTKSSKLFSFTFVNFEKRHLPFLPLECPDDQYGRNCLQSCSENCHVSKKCDKKTGACHGGCIEGWKIPQCNKGT